MKRTLLRYRAEALFLTLFLTLFKILPLDCASAAGGAIGRAIGPRLGASRTALANLALALPGRPEEDRRAAVKEMWENLGRVIAEYPHLEKIGRERVTLECAPETARLIQENVPCLMISGHLANWEIAAAAMLARFGKPLDLTYRAPNNPYVDRMLVKIRSLNGKIRSHAKSREGGQEIVRAMREGRYIAMLIDQKYNEGLSVPFFGRPAMTNPAFIHLGRKFGYPLIPARIERTNGAHFKITIQGPLTVSERPDEDVIAQAHALLEEWIGARPGQWLWLHRRWRDEKSGNQGS